MIAHGRATGVASSTPSTGRSRPLGQVLEPLLVLTAFAGAGAFVGWIWERWWTPTVGVVVDGTWVPGYRAEGDLFVFDFPSLEGFFDGTAMYVVLGVAAGVLLGVLCSLLGRRSELVMLVAVTAGSALASLVAYRLGTHLGPVDPTTLEADAATGTVLPAALSIKGASPFVAWPLGSLLGLCVTYLLTAVTAESRRRESDDPRWLERPTWLDEDSSGPRPGSASS
jgi:hypothetical protein